MHGYSSSLVGMWNENQPLLNSSPSGHALSAMSPNHAQAVTVVEEALVFSGNVALLMWLDVKPGETITFILKKS